MAEVQQATTQQATKAPAAVTMPTGGKAAFQDRMTVLLSGRIQTCRQVGQRRDGMPLFETVVLMPALDLYSFPRRYCVVSEARLGRDGDDLTVEAEVTCQPWKDSKGRMHYPHYLWAVR